MVKNSPLWILTIALWLLSSTASAQSVWIYRLFSSNGGEVQMTGWDTYNGWYGPAHLNFSFPAPLAGGPMSSLSVNSGSLSFEYLYYLNINSVIQEVFGSTAASGGWVINPVYLGYTPAGGRWSLTSFWNGGQHIYFVATNGHIIEGYKTANGWNPGDLTAVTGGPNASGAALSSYVDSSGGQHIWYVTSNQRVYELYYNPSSHAWSNQDLTSATGGALAQSGSPVTGFIDSTGNGVFYIGTNQHVYQMYYNPSTFRWSNGDITAATGAPSAELGSYLTGFTDSAGQHVYYTSTNRHIYQLYWNPSTKRWGYGDLTAQTGALPATVASPLTSFGGVVGEHVFYQTPYNGGTALGELSWSSSTGWRANAPLGTSGVNPYTVNWPMTSLYCTGDLQNGVCN